MSRDDNEIEAANAPRRWRRKVLILPPVLLGIAVLAAAMLLRGDPPQSPPAEMSRTVRVIEATPHDVVPRVTGFGTVRPIAVWNAVAQVGGKILRMHPAFRAGEIIDAGEEIARIDPSDTELAIAQAEANIRSAEAKLAEQEVTETNLKALLAIERESLRLKEAQRQRQRDLLRRGTAAQASVDREERETLAQRKIVADLENSLRLLPTQRAVQTEQIAVYKSNLASAKLDLGRTRIVMPFRGRVAEVNAETTQFVQPGTRLGVVDDISVSEIEAQFPIAQLSNFARSFDARKRGATGYVENIAKFTADAGIHALVRLNAGDRTIAWSGRIVRGSDNVDQQTRTIGIIVAVPDSYASAIPGVRPPLTKGMFVEVELRGQPAAGQLVVPRASLHSGRLLLANGENRLEARPVRVGMALGDFVLIEEGLNRGDRVVVSDVTPAIPGMLLKPVRDGSLEEKIGAVSAGAEARP